MSLLLQSPPWLTASIGGILTTLLCFQLARKRTGGKTGHLPPGPTPFPLIGNLLDMPTESEWKTFSEWGRKYGGICSIKLFGQVMVVVNSPSAFDQLDKQGSIFSSRPHMEMGGELCGYSQTLVLAPSSARWRNYRKYVSKIIGTPSSNERFAALEESETYRFLRRALEDPDALSDHIRTMSGAVILRLTYGITPQTREDPFVELIKRANDNFVIVAQPGHWLVDVIPRIMNALPEWLLFGGGFKSAARMYRKAFDDMVNVPYDQVLKEMDNHVAPPSFVSNILEEKPEAQMTPDEIFELKHTAASLYGGGADTTASDQYAFFLAMTLFPEVQKKAQAEIDSVIGSDRLVKLSDRRSLPYVQAVVTELLRWNSVAPTGVPHLAVDDGHVDGYLIPKGSFVITNLWQILHDEETYPDPFRFDPERFLESPGKQPQRDPRFACFGWRPRICPGLHLADATVFLLVANSLAAFNISKALDENGNEITPVHENTTGVISHPKPFKCSIKPRNEKVVHLVADACDQA